MNCPECKGPARVLYETADYVAVQCLNGHWRIRKTWGVLHRQKIYPIYLVEVGQR